MKCVILQPSYIPWRGYFHQIAKADVFVFYDDVKYDRNGWRNRNRIKTAAGPQWLTIPVYTQNLETNKTPINQIRIDWNQKWNKKHWSAIKTNYAKAPFFTKYSLLIESFYARHDEFLADFTIEFTIALAQELGITGKNFLRSSSLENISGTKTDRLTAILSKIGASHYLSGPSARGYLEEDKLTNLGITLEYMEYNYPAYDQLYPPYDPQISILDLLFMNGPNSLDLIV